MFLSTFHKFIALSRDTKGFSVHFRLDLCTLEIWTLYRMLSSQRVQNVLTPTQKSFVDRFIALYDNLDSLTESSNSDA